MTALRAVWSSAPTAQGKGCAKRDVEDAVPYTLAAPARPDSAAGRIQLSAICRAKAAACASMPGSFTRLPRSLAVSSRENRGGR